MPVFTVQVTKLVQFTYYNTFSKIPPSTSMHFATRVRTWRVARLYSVQCTVYSKVLYRQFGIGHMFRGSVANKYCITDLDEAVLLGNSFTIALTIITVTLT
jgi:hypothetical protein